MSQPSPNTANPAGHCTSNGWNGSAVCADAGRQGTVQLGPEGLGLASNEEPQAACALCEPSGTPQQQRRPDREHDTQVARCYDGSASGVGLRGLQNLCGGTLCTSRATVALRIGSNGKPRRPSSAPTRRRPGRVGAEHRQASIWGRGWTLAAGEMPSRERRTATDRGICPATPRTRAEEEQMKLRDGLVRLVLLRFTATAQCYYYVWATCFGFMLLLRRRKHRLLTAGRCGMPTTHLFIAAAQNDSWTTVTLSPVHAYFCFTLAPHRPNDVKHNL